MDNQVTIEAVLFSVGKPVSVEEIAQAGGLSEESVRVALKKLIAGYKKRQTAIEIAKVGSKYTMQLKPDILPKAGKFAPTTIPKPVLKTAALIAYYQPIKQSKLLMMAGNKVYEHVKSLADLGLISAKKYSHTFILTTSKKFPEYFGIPTARREDIKKWIAEKVGIKLSPKAQKDPEVDEMAESDKAVDEKPADGSPGDDAEANSK
jgi:segregation and condensation protein B